VPAEEGIRLYASQPQLYDIAFSWDTSEEVDWLLLRLGDDCTTVLEPACGSGRFLVAFGRRGIDAVGIDNSPAMVQLANERLRAERLPGLAALADMTAFDLGRLFDGAFCPVDSLAYLLDASQLIRHLDCVAKYLRPGSRYLVQLELRNPVDPWSGVRPSIWEAEREGIRVRTTWRVEEIDLENGFEFQRGTIECLSGPEAGRVLDEVHRMAAWTPERWAEAIAASPFHYRAIYDGDEDGRPERPLGTSGRLLWHELAIRDW
jgi:SAM-dependent methyltransferase